LTTYNYYIKVENSVFKDIYKINISKEYLQFDKFFFLFENNPKLKKKVEGEWEKQLEIITNINYNDFFYVPQCIALISKYPYVNQMHTSLESLLKVSHKQDAFQLIPQILQIIKGIPMPSIKKQVSFYLPYIENSVSLQCLVQKQLPLTNFKFGRLLELLNTDIILIIFHLLQLEQKILFVGKEYNQIAELIDLFSNLLYPLE